MKFKRPIDKEKFVLALFEDGPEWARVEAQGIKTRYLRAADAQRILRQIGVLSVKEKSDVIVLV